MFPSELIRAALPFLTREEKEELLNIVSEGIPEDVIADLKEAAGIATRIHKRLEQNQALFAADIKRWNEICAKHFPKMQDAPEELTKI